jgi:hypothetical protein
MVKRLILHIGTHKTGTTSLQKHLAEADKEGQLQGVLYPRTGRPSDHHGLAQHQLAWSLHPHPVGPAPPAGELFAALAAEMAASEASTVVLSSEDLSELPEPGQLAALLPKAHVHIYVCLRPQEEYFNAKYQTLLLHYGEQQSAAQFFRTRMEEGDYDQLLRRWRRAFPMARLTVRLFEKGAPVRSDIVADFRRVMGLEEAIPQTREQARDNPTLPAHAVVALQELSSRGLTPEDKLQLAWVCGLVYQNSNDDRYLYTAEERAEIRDCFREANRRVRVRLGGAEGELFRSEPLPEQPSGPMIDPLVRLTMDLSRSAIGS